MIKTIIFKYITSTFYSMAIIQDVETKKYYIAIIDEYCIDAPASLTEISRETLKSLSTDLNKNEEFYAYLCEDNEEELKKYE